MVYVLAGIMVLWALLATFIAYGRQRVKYMKKWRLRHHVGRFSDVSDEVCDCQKAIDDGLV